MTKSNHGDLEYTVVVSPEAETDIVGILQYTLMEWGLEQTVKYQGIIDEGLEALQYNPGIGHSRRDIPKGYKALQVGQHVIIFRIDERIVYVIRVLHGSMDFPGRF